MGLIFLWFWLFFARKSQKVFDVYGTLSYKEGQGTKRCPKYARKIQKRQSVKGLKGKFLSLIFFGFFYF